MYKILYKDFIADASLSVNYNVDYDYLTFYNKSIGEIDYIQSTDHIYLIVDLDNSSIVGAKIMGLMNYFSLEELNELEYPFVADSIKKIYHRIANTPYSSE
ncbi:hypothetical protein [Enterococcus innesii]|uniref:hypothetical protein n=1 Tax=Enterococcus innesii TaxID=2839759 RepID=UPI00206DDE93|nr:MAG TPA: hypothetical protein [Caudoviricetes sp.]